MSLYEVTENLEKMGFISDATIIKVVVKDIKEKTVINTTLSVECARYFFGNLKSMGNSIITETFERHIPSTTTLFQFVIKCEEEFK